MGDEFAFGESKNVLLERLNEFSNNVISESELKTKYNLGKNYAEFILKNKPQLRFDIDKFVKCSYRPFDDRYTYFDNKIIWRWRVNVMQHFLAGENIGLIVGRQSTGEYWCNIQLSKHMIDNRYHYSYKGTSSQFPLYLYTETNGQQSIAQTSEKTPNLNSEIVQQIAEKLGLTFTPEKDTSAGSASMNTFAPIDILDYIYAVLHSPTYREKYKEFLKIDFPRVPYPKDASTFWSLVEKGGAIRALHLLESPLLDTFITTYPESGTNQVGKVRYDNGKVYINETQYFDKVPQIAWEFYIGGYQPAQKWLKDRKDRVLTFEDINHYQKIIIALTETDRLMKEIDGLGIEW